MSIVDNSVKPFQDHHNKNTLEDDTTVPALSPKHLPSCGTFRRKLRLTTGGVGGSLVAKQGEVEPTTNYEYEEYDVLKLLSSGVVGKVYLVRSRPQQKKSLAADSPADSPNTTPTKKEKGEQHSISSNGKDHHHVQQKELLASSEEQPRLYALKVLRQGPSLGKNAYSKYMEPEIQALRTLGLHGDNQEVSHAVNVDHKAPIMGSSSSYPGDAAAKKRLLNLVGYGLTKRDASELRQFQDDTESSQKNLQSETISTTTTMVDESDHQIPSSSPAPPPAGFLSLIGDDSNASDGGHCREEVTGFVTRGGEDAGLDKTFVGTELGTENAQVSYMLMERMLGDVMEVVVDGEDGNSLWKENTLFYDDKSVGDVFARLFFRQMLDALEYAHRHGLVHRDVKPENIMVDENLNFRLIDFGYAAGLNILPHLDDDNHALLKEVTVKNAEQSLKKEGSPLNLWKFQKSGLSSSNNSSAQIKNEDNAQKKKTNQINEQEQEHTQIAKKYVDNALTNALNELSMEEATQGGHWKTAEEHKEVSGNDFYNIVKYDSRLPLRSDVGTLEFNAPQISGDMNHDKSNDGHYDAVKADIWALGVSLFKLRQAMNPWHVACANESKHFTWWKKKPVAYKRFITKHRKGLRERRNSKPFCLREHIGEIGEELEKNIVWEKDGCSMKFCDEADAHFWELMENMLNPDEAERWSIAEIREKSKWLNAEKATEDDHRRMLAIRVFFQKRM